MHLIHAGRTVFDTVQPIFHEVAQNSDSVSSHHASGAPSNINHSSSPHRPLDLSPTSTTRPRHAFLPGRSLHSVLLSAVSPTPRPAPAIEAEANGPIPPLPPTRREEGTSRAPTMTRIDPYPHLESYKYSRSILATLCFHGFSANKYFSAHAVTVLLRNKFSSNEKGKEVN